MNMHSDIIFFIVITFSFTIRVNFASKTCVGNHNVYYCREVETCCETGCCITDYSKYLWVFLFGIMFVILVLYFCVRFFCEGKAINENNASRAPHEIPSSNQGIFRSTTTSTRENRPIVTVPEPQQNESTVLNHPITPPPSYEVALSAPFLHPEDRVPSYEDVTAGKNT